MKYSIKKEIFGYNRMGEIMKKQGIIDGHSDFLEVGFDKRLSIVNENLMFNVLDAYKYRPYIQLAAIFLHTKYVGNHQAYERVKAILQYFEREYTNWKEEYHLEKVTSSSDFHQVMNQKKIGMVLTLENMAAIGEDITKIKELYDKGIRIMSLTWNDDNLLACGAKTQKDLGITTFGKACIDQMNQLGILIDVSHLSRRSFQDIRQMEQGNVLATHSCVNALCENTRNLTDEEIKYIAKKQGVIGICFYHAFLTSQKNYATIDDIIDHITYIANLVGIEYVGIGSDFDGMESEDLPIGIKGVRDLDHLMDRLLTRGFSSYEVEKIM